MTRGLHVQAQRVTVRRGRRAIVDDLSLEVRPGVLAALVGPSGSGKTTMLTVTPATRAPWTGRVQVAHQAFGLLSLLSAAENVESAAQALPRHRRPTRAALRDAAAETLAEVGLGARVDHLVEELSGGEQQRVALARALVNRELVVALLCATATSGTTSLADGRRVT